MDTTFSVAAMPWARRKKPGRQTWHEELGFEGGQVGLGGAACLMPVAELAPHGAPAGQVVGPEVGEC